MSVLPKIESIFKVELPPSAKRKKVIDFSLCILCQTKTNCPLVNPKCYEKMLDCINKRAEWNDSEYCNISYQIGNLTNDYLKSKNAAWHSDCYKKCTHKGSMDRGLDSDDEY